MNMFIGPFLSGFRIIRRSVLTSMKQQQCKDLRRDFTVSYFEQIKLISSDCVDCALVCLKSAHAVFYKQKAYKPYSGVA